LLLCIVWREPRRGGVRAFKEIWDINGRAAFYVTKKIRTLYEKSGALGKRCKIGAEKRLKMIGSLIENSPGLSEEQNQN
jgi:hypothetical protein